MASIYIMFLAFYHDPIGLCLWIFAFRLCARRVSISRLNRKRQLKLRRGLFYNGTRL